MKKALKKIIAITMALAPLTMVPPLTHAQREPVTLSLPTSSTYGFDNLNQAISSVMNLVFFFALLLVLIYLVWGGIQWITAGGDKQGTEAARGKITGAIIGIIIVAVAFAIYNLLLTFIGAGSGFVVGGPRT